MNSEGTLSTLPLDHVDPPPFLLPTFFVIGAPKCGTTSLHAYLSRHPEISMSSVKEPFIFASEDWRSRLSEYAALLDSAAPVRGESSTVYSQFPHFGDVPARIESVVPRASLLYVVRDPVDRALAHYRQRVVDGRESRRAEDALADYDEADSVYLAASRYATQLRLYLRRFPRSRFLVLDQEELRERPAKALSKVFAFLGVASGAGVMTHAVSLNAREDQRLPTAAGRRLSGSRLLEAARRIPLPDRARRGARRAISRPVPTVTLEPALRDEIAASLRGEVAWLREFTGLDFPGWSV